jgi:hypothetical protein
MAISKHVCIALLQSHSAGCQFLSMNPENTYSLWQLVPSLSQNSRRVVESHGNGARHGRVS